MKQNHNLCPNCQSKKQQKIVIKTSYKLLKCLSCSMIWDFNPPSDPEKLYQKEHYFKNTDHQGGYANYFQGLKINRKTFFERYKKIKSMVKSNGRLLDIGCALGDSLIVAKKLGFKKAEGLEISSYAVKFSRKRGLKVYQGNLSSNLFSSNSFDVITCQDVIEHMPKPLSELKIIFKILKPKGLVYIVTPDINGFWSKVLGSLWYHYKPGEHLVYFSKKTIKEALRKVGFKDIEARPTLHILTIEYILNRLCFYSEPIFGTLLKIVRNTPLKDLAIRVYTDEIEVWAKKS